MLGFQCSIKSYKTFWFFFLLCAITWKIIFFIGVFNRESAIPVPELRSYGSGSQTQFLSLKLRENYCKICTGTGVHESVTVVCEGRWWAATTSPAPTATSTCTLSPAGYRSGSPSGPRYSFLRNINCRQRLVFGSRSRILGSFLAFRIRTGNY